MSVEEKGIRADGPLFDLPGGQVKAAIGGVYDSMNVTFVRANTTGGTLVFNPSFDSEPYNVWAGFVQVNVPIFGDNFNFPGFRRFDLEASWRHDQYNSPGQNGAPAPLTGGTSNPKMGFTWVLSEDAGVSIKGSWGTSFRFANAGEYSVIASDSVQDYGLPASSFGAIAINCLAGLAPANTLAARLQNAGFGCTTQPGGISWGGAPHAPLRNYIDPNTGLPAVREGGTALPPERSTNYSVGFEFAPQAFLKGLDLQATWYSVKINGTLLGFNNPNSSSIADPNQDFHYVTPSSVGCAGPGTPSQAAINAANANPTACAPFETMVAQVLFDSANSTAPLNSLTSIYWINDGGTASTGWLKVEGVDFQGSYDWDMGDLGAWNTGVTGTYYLHRNFVTTSGSPVSDAFHQTLSPVGGIAQNGVETLPRFKYRARLGWSNGSWNVTGFVNYESHYYHTQSAPPNVNYQCQSTGSSVGGGSYPCAIFGYSNVQPPWYTFDLSVGYDTGDTPANEYLRNIGIQLVVQNLMGIHPAFQYGPSNAGRGLAAYDILKSDLGRVWNITITKTW
jgi:iron complex outermembrane receptor protein